MQELISQDKLQLIVNLKRGDRLNLEVHSTYSVQDLKDSPNLKKFGKFSSRVNRKSNEQLKLE